MSNTQLKYINSAEHVLRHVRSAVLNAASLPVKSIQSWEGKVVKWWVNITARKHWYTLWIGVVFLKITFPNSIANGLIWDVVPKARERSMATTFRIIIVR